MQDECIKLQNGVAFALWIVSISLAVPLSAFAQNIQAGGGGAEGSQPAATPGKAGQRQPLGNGSPQTLGQATSKKVVDGALPFFAAYESKLAGGGTFSVDTKGITLQTVDNAVKFRIGGRLQLDGNVADLRPKSLGPALTDDVLVRRAYFESYLTLYDALEIAFQYDFANDTQPVQDAVLAYRGLSHVVLTVGNFKEPFGQDQLRGSTTTTFAERSLTNALFPSYSFGGAIGTFGDRWTATAGVYGNDGNLGIQDNGVSGTARVTYAPVLNQEQVLHFGIAGSYRALDPSLTPFSISSRPEDRDFARSLVSTGTLRNAQSVGRLDLETIYQYRSYRITGEYAFANVGGVTPTAANVGQGSRFFQSGYVEGAWVVNG